MSLWDFLLNRETVSSYFRVHWVLFDIYLIDITKVKTFFFLFQLKAVFESISTKPCTFFQKYVHIDRCTSFETAKLFFLQCVDLVPKSTYMYLENEQAKVTWNGGQSNSVEKARSTKLSNCNVSAPFNFRKKEVTTDGIYRMYKFTYLNFWHHYPPYITTLTKLTIFSKSAFVF